MAEDTVGCSLSEEAEMWVISKVLAGIGWGMDGCEGNHTKARAVFTNTHSNE